MPARGGLLVDPASIDHSCLSGLSGAYPAFPILRAAPGDVSIVTDFHLSTPSNRPRARAFAIPFDGEPGLFNAITDVPGVSVGYTTLISGNGPLIVGHGPVRMGVTAILPRPQG